MGRSTKFLPRLLINIMPTKKAVKKVVEKKAVVKKAPRAVAKKPVAVKVAVVKEKAPVTPRPFPVFEGVRVVAVLDKGHTKTHNHCKMANGTTMHVPKVLF